VQVKVQGLRMYVDARDSIVGHALIRDGVWEQYESQTVRIDDSVRHDGSGCGRPHRVLHRSCGAGGGTPGSCGLAFEPDPRAFTLLRRNVDVNSVCRSRDRPAGRASRTRSRRPSCSAIGQRRHSLLSPRRICEPTGTPASFRTTTMDAVLADQRVGKLDVVKIDTQGAEALVFAGALRAFAHGPLRCFVEFWPFGLRNLGADPVDLLRTWTRAASRSVDRCGLPRGEGGERGRGHERMQRRPVPLRGPCYWRRTDPRPVKSERL